MHRRVRGERTSLSGTLWVAASVTLALALARDFGWCVVGPVEKDASETCILNPQG
jgi:hypothetical protein